MNKNRMKVGLALVIVCGIALSYGCAQQPTELEKSIPELAQSTQKGERIFLINHHENIDEDMILTDDDILAVCHRMTHPYILASEKWGGSYDVTPNNVRNLMIKIEQSETLTDGMKGELLGYLGEYSEGDFSSSVKFHNYVWREQEGNVGKATGLSSKAK